jgi:hypothetical protein
VIAVVGKTRAHSAFRNSTFILAIIALSMRPDASHQPSASPICRFVSEGVHRCSGGLTSGSDGLRRRLPRTGAFGVPGSAPYRAQAHIAPLPASTAPRLSLPHPRYPHRFTCSRDECGVIAGSLRRGGLSYISAVSFLFAFSVFGDVKRGLFFH